MNNHSHQMFIPKITNLVIFIGCLLLLGFGLFLEHVRGLEPCILCMVQRFFFLLIAIVTGLAFFHNPGNLGVRIYALLTGFFAGLGAAVAGRQVWLQHLPADKVPECGPDLFFMLEAYPLSEAFIEIISGSGDCAKVNWMFLGFSIPEWAIVIFIAIFSVSASMFIQHQRPISEVRKTTA